MYENINQIINPTYCYPYKFWRGKITKGNKRCSPKVHKTKRNIVLKTNPQYKL